MENNYLYIKKEDGEIVVSSSDGVFSSIITLDKKEKFKKLYGNKEVELPSHVITIYDNYSSSFSSGSNGYLTKIRLNKDNFEFYHNWWNYGWISFDEVKEKYPCAACKVESLIDYLIK